MYTIFGTKIYLRNNLNDENEIKKQIHEKTGYDTSRIYTYSKFTGVFNTIQMKDDSINLLAEYGVPDYIYWYYKGNKETISYLDYSKVKIISDHIFDRESEYLQVVFDNKTLTEIEDISMIYKIFKHFIISEMEKEHSTVEKKEIEISKYAEILQKEKFSIKELSEMEKMEICSNMEEIVKDIFK